MSLVARLASQIGDGLANNTDFLQRVANSIPLPEDKDDARSIADNTSTGYAASANTEDSTVYNPPPFGGYQRIEEKKTKKDSCLFIEYRGLSLSIEGTWLAGKSMVAERERRRELERQRERESARERKRESERENEREKERERAQERGEGDKVSLIESLRRQG